MKKTFATLASALVIASAAAPATAFADGCKYCCTVTVTVTCGAK